jgi:hypothetical protein
MQIISAPNYKITLLALLSLRGKTDPISRVQLAKILLLPPKNEIINVILFCEKITKCVLG